MATFPANIVSFREKENLPGLEFDAENKKTFFVEDLQKIEDEIIGIEETLGEEILGDAETVADRLSAIELITNAILDKTWPVGSIYLSVVSTDPSETLGGTWERYANGRTIVGVNESDGDFNTAEETGGAKTHRLTTNEIPGHAHGASVDGYGFNLIKDWGGANVRRANMDEAGSGFFILGSSNTNDIYWAANTANAGGGAAHNNLPPYITTYLWKRVS